MDDKTQTDKQQGPLIESMKDGSGQQKTEAADDGMLHLVVRGPEKNLFEGPIESMTSKNKNGTFDVLPYHENFISIIQDEITIREKGKSPQEISVGGAILKVSKNQVEVYIGMETLTAGAQPAPTPPAAPATPSSK